jgi:hypothetical protein
VLVELNGYFDYEESFTELSTVMDKAAKEAGLQSRVKNCKSKKTCSGKFFGVGVLR